MPKVQRAKNPASNSFCEQCGAKLPEAGAEKNVKMAAASSSNPQKFKWSTNPKIKKSAPSPIFGNCFRIRPVLAIVLASIGLYGPAAAHPIHPF